MEDELKATKIMYEYLDEDVRRDYFLTNEEFKKFEDEVARLKEEIKSAGC